jgi:hypothetical protein
MARNKRATFGTVWTFKTRRFLVSLNLERDYSYRYDGEDADGETQAGLDDGSLVAFDSSVIVEFDGEEIARESLGGSVYAADEVAAFYTDHRDADHLNRNCSTMRAARGNVVICHYFPSMVQEAIAAARQIMLDQIEEARSLPYIRSAAA